MENGQIWNRPLVKRGGLTNILFKVGAVKNSWKKRSKTPGILWSLKGKTYAKTIGEEEKETARQ